MKTILYMLISFILGMLAMDYIISKDKSENKQKELLGKLGLYYEIFNIWFDIKQRGVRVGDYMKKKSYSHVVIYGMKELGERLYSELVNEGIEVVCVVDNNRSVLVQSQLLSPEDDIPNADVMIVTPEYYFKEIEEKMEKKVDYPIIKLSKLLSDASRCAYK